MSAPKYDIIRDLVREKVAVILIDHAQSIPYESRAAIAYQIAHDVCDDLRRADPASVSSSKGDES